MVIDARRCNTPNHGVYIFSRMAFIKAREKIGENMARKKYSDYNDGNVEEKGSTMHSYKTLLDALNDKMRIEYLIRKNGWLDIETFNIIFAIHPSKPIPAGLGWDYGKMKDIEIRQRYDGRYEIVMPRPKRQDHGRYGFGIQTEDE